MLSKTDVQKDIHFICIDKRVKDANNKTYIILDNGQKIILPENVTKVPALLLLTQGYQVLYGEQIMHHLKPKQQQEVKVATQNNMEPMAFSLGGGGFGDVVSDQYSFLDQGSDELSAQGNGGVRQMHNYVDLNTAFNGKISNHNANSDNNTTIRGTKKIGEDDSNRLMEDKIKQMQAEREADMNCLKSRPPMF